MGLKWEITPCLPQEPHCFNSGSSQKEGEGFVSNKWSNILDVGPFVLYKLNYFDFADMKNGEIREVFLNMED